MGNQIGGMKTAAKRAGVSFEFYMQLRKLGFKFCSTCRVFKPASRFHRSKYGSFGLQPSCAACQLAYKNKNYKKVLVPKKRPKGGRYKKPVNGDKIQAKHRINYLVEKKLIPAAGSLPCSMCGDTSHKHVYHHPSYKPEHHESVVSLCIKCHSSIHHKKG